MKNTRRIVAGLALACLTAAGLAPAAAAAGPPSAFSGLNALRDPALVRTDSGPVRGSVTGRHRTFEGVPYAAPPVGGLRWAPPQPPELWAEVRDATEPGSPCPQPPGLPIGRPGTNEDCLYLNVTTPRTRSAKRPVLVWVHGGGFTFGQGDMHHAERLASMGDAVVVTINYRLGALGFLAHPGLERSGTFGLEDQQAALRWVRRNAAAFGGDPGNVTLMGESAGGFSVCSHLAAPSSAGLFHRAIVQSGPCVNPFTRSRAEAERDGAELAAKVGCADLACLRRVPVADLLAALGPGFEAGITPMHGGPVLPVEPRKAIASGKFNRVPVLHGSNRDEERLRVGGLELQPGGAPMTPAEYVQQIRETFGAKADKVLARYPLRAYGSPGEALSAVLTDHDWSVPALDTHRMLSRHVPTFAYEFAERDNPWFRGLPKPSFSPGAYHVAEVAYLFDVEYGDPLTPRQLALANRMAAYWTNFARTGNPNGPGEPLWLPYHRFLPYVQSVAAGRIGPADFARDHHYTFWKEL